MTRMNPTHSGVRRIKPPALAPLAALVLLALLCVAESGTLAAQGQNSDGDETLRQTLAELALARARVLQEDDEAAAIHRQILQLYSRLDRVLDRNPEIQDLRSRLELLRSERPHPITEPASSGDKQP